MQRTVTPRQMQTIFDVHHFNLSETERKRIEDDLDGLERQVENFPIAGLHILIEGNARSHDVSVKLTLILPGDTLVANDHDPILLVAVERCLVSLLHGVEGYKSRLDREEDRQKIEKGTHHPVHPTRDIDVGNVDQAVAAGDYAAFRAAMLPFEDVVQARAGRWVQRFPEYDARVGRDVKLPDVTEEIFLTAFDRFAARPEGVPLGVWLTNLIDPAVRALMTRTTEELENINLTRSALEATQPIGNG
jgi:ribosome-associated translation inhibitor RaiA